VGEICDGKDLWRRCVVKTEWKRLGVIDDESGDNGTGELR